jgi:tetratricopeptide (TPR) repeat protein
MSNLALSSTTRRFLAGILACTSFVLLQVPEATAARKNKKEPKAVLNGRVLNQADETLAGVKVTVRGTDFEEMLTTNDKGAFSLDIVNASGTYVVRLKKGGYAPFDAEIELTINEEMNLDFHLLDAVTGRKQDAIRVYNLGARAFAAGDKAKAKEIFLEAIALDSQLAEPYLGLTDIYLSEELYEEAAAAAEKYLTFKPDEEAVRKMAYQAYLKLGDEEKVNEYRARMANTDLAPDLAVQVFNEGALASQAGDLALAVKKFRAALELNPEFKEAWAALSTVYYNQEDYSSSLAAAEKVLEVEPTNAQGLRMRYISYDAQNDLQQIPAALNAYAAIDPQGAAQILYQRADFDFRDGLHEPAQKALLKVLELDPDLARAHYTLGLTYASTDPAKAKMHLLKFVEMAPDDPEAPTAKEMADYF